MAGSVDGEHGFQIAPMLDILFVLLLFFMVSAGAQKHERHLTTQLPGSGAAGQSPVQIDIDAEGQVTIATQPVDTPTDPKMPQLVERLRGIVKAQPDQPVVITPSSSAKQQRVVDVLDACAAAEVRNLAFGTPQD